MGDEFQCGFCGGHFSQSELAGWIGVGDLAAACVPCYGRFTRARSTFPDQDMHELVETVKLHCALDQLSEEQRQKLWRLIFLLRNRSNRANRLVSLAERGQLSVGQLLTII